MPRMTWVLLAGLSLLITAMLTHAALEQRLYSITVPGMSCERAQELSAQVMERLRYTVTKTTPATRNEPGVIRGARDGARGPETVSVEIACRSDAVRVDANPDVPPCEQANRITRQSVEQLGYAVTKFIPAVMDGRQGIVRGKKEEDGKTDLVELIISCTQEVVYIDTRADNPVVLGTNFSSAITDFRRGFFSLFKPMAEAEQRKKSR